MATRRHTNHRLSPSGPPLQPEEPGEWVRYFSGVPLSEGVTLADNVLTSIFDLVFPTQIEVDTSGGNVRLGLHMEVGFTPDIDATGIASVLFVARALRTAPSVSTFPGVQIGPDGTLGSGSLVTGFQQLSFDVEVTDLASLGPIRGVGLSMQLVAPAPPDPLHVDAAQTLGVLYRLA